MHDGVASAASGPDVRTNLWRLVFRTRSVMVSALAVAAVLIPSVGDHRMAAAAVLVFGALPYNLALGWYVKRAGAPPPAVAIVDKVFAAAFVLVEPGTWLAVVIVMLTTLAQDAVAFGRRYPAVVTALSTVLLVVAALLVPVADPVFGITVFAIAGTSLVVIVGSLSQGERHLRTHFGELVEGIGAVVWEMDADGRFVYLSPLAETLFGYPVESWYDLDNAAARMHPDDMVTSVEAIASLGPGEVTDFESRITAADGRIVHLWTVARADPGVSGQIKRLRGVAMDVTARHRAERTVRIYRDIVEGIPTALVVMRPDDDSVESLRILAANPAAVEMIGVESSELAGELARDVCPWTTTFLHDQLERLLSDGEAEVIEGLRDEVDGQERVLTLHLFPLAEGAIGLAMYDVTERVQATETLQHRALHDDMTDLPNRVLLQDRLEQALSDAARRHEGVALLVMDVDQFKEVNEALGHNQGDRMLIELGRRLADVLRDCDTVARLGGDEFAVLLTDSSTAGATKAAERVIRALEDPMEVEGISLQASVSIGIACFPDHAGDAESLTQRADVALYQAKGGPEPWAIYAPEEDRSSVKRLTLLGQLRRAIDVDELELHYQPIVDLRRSTIVHAEALVRWRHPTHGLMAPGEFIELAEVSGMIRPLTRWVVEHAVVEAALWHATGHDVGVAANLSVRSLTDRGLLSWVGDLLAEHDLPDRQLSLEITESEVMEDPLLAMDLLGGLRELGVRTSVDDFGTGHSSLSYLRHLPVDEIKVDRSFVMPMDSELNDAMIVRSIIDLGHNLGVGVIAEGVEDEPTLQRLTDLGCDRAQGFLISRPVPAEVFRDELAKPLPFGGWKTRRRFVRRAG